MSRGKWIGRIVVALGCGVAAAYLVVHQFGVAGQSDVNPPICTNSFGNEIGCEADSIVRPIAWALLVVVPTVLMLLQSRRAR